MKTLVMFRYNKKENDLYAVFAEITNRVGDLSCYSHIGQHSACSIGYMFESRPATKKEYSPLLEELKQIGYTDLKVCR